MKYTINRISSGEEELILNYIEETEEVARVLAFMHREGRKLLCFKDKEQVVISPEDILYIETVDGRTSYIQRQKYIK